VKTLGSDAFPGRKPFTRGEEQTLAYLEEEFKKIRQDMMKEHKQDL